MERLELGKVEIFKKLDQFSKDELITKFASLEEEHHRAIKEIYRLRYQNLTEEQLNMILQEHLNELRHDIYGASSERYKKVPKAPVKKDPAPRIKQPSERYPNVNIKHIKVEADPTPGCDACGKIMMDSGMTEDSEQLTVTPPQEVRDFKIHARYLSLQLSFLHEDCGLCSTDR